MRSAAVRLGSSMHAMLSTVVAAAAGCSQVASAAACQPSTFHQQPAGRASQHVRQQRQHQRRPLGNCITWAATNGNMSPCFSDMARRRRLFCASASAQPALAADEEGAGWEEVCPPLQLNLASPAAQRLPLRQEDASRSGLCQTQQQQEQHTAAGPQVATPQAVALLDSQHQPAVPQQPVSSSSQDQQQQQLLHEQEAFQLLVPNLGYTCLNVELLQRHGIRTNRSCWRRTFEARGLPHVSRLALANCRDLLPIVEWNRQHGVHFFRIPSALFPWSQAYELEQLPDYEEIAATLAQVGAAARAARQRLTAHPSHFVQLASPNEDLLARSIQHLELNSRVFDLMGYPPSHTNKINIHVGAIHGSKPEALRRFAAAVDRLSDSCRARLTVENDDRPAFFSLAELLPLHAMAHTPLVFDYLHHALVPGGLSEEEALLAALDTWPPGIRPVVHYSEPSEKSELPRRAHSYMLTQPFSLYGREADVDVMLEAKGSSNALLFYRDELQLGRKLETAVVPAARARRPAPKQQ